MKPRSRTSLTSEMRRSGRGPTSPPATSPRTSSTSPECLRSGRRSAATSGPAWTLSSMPRSRSATTVGLQRAPSSRMMSLPVRWPGFPRGRRRRKGGSTRSMESPTATELALPGLEGGVVTEPSPQHFIERGPLKRLMVFAGRSHPELAAAIADKLDVELGDVELETFANGETYCRYLESIRGADVFIVQTGIEDVDRNLMELVFMIQAAKLASAKRITAVMPLYPYARQDRKAKPREPISARLVADMVQLAGADRVLTMDLHAGQIQGFFTIPVDHMTAQPLFARHFRDLGLTGPGVVSVAPDEGRAKVAVRFANMIEGDFAIMHKTRPARDQAEITEVTGKVRDKIAIVGDDVIMTGGTLIANVHALLAQGAREVYVYATHGVFCGGALAKFHDAPIEGMVVTDTVPINRIEAPPNLTVLPVAGLLAETIMNVFADDSVSAIFGGENQLF